MMIFLELQHVFKVFRRILAFFIERDYFYQKLFKPQSVFYNLFSHNFIS